MEPAGAKHHSGICPMEEDYREEAVIAAPGTETFREFVLFAHNGIRLLDKDGNLIKTTEQGMEPGEEGGHEAPDHEDTGEKGYNYRCEPMVERWSRPERQAVVGEEVVREMSWTRCVESV